MKNEIEQLLKELIERVDRIANSLEKLVRLKVLEYDLEDEMDYSTWTKEELVYHLMENDMDDTGTKEEMIARLEGGYCPSEEFEFDFDWDKYSELSDLAKKNMWKNVTVEELKEELRGMGLPVSGKKADLIKRLEKEF
jgi:hypothetical protein